MKRAFVIAMVLVGVALAAAMPAVLASGESGSSARGSARPAQGGLKPFDSCERLRGYLQRHRAALRQGPIGFPEGAIDDIAGGQAAAAGSAPSPAPTQTNVQEEGVDEPDLVKARGSTLFALAGDRLRVLDVSGAEPALLESVELPDGPGSYVSERQLLLSGDFALVISRVYGATGSRTLLTELDVADPTAIRMLATESVEGDYVSARLTGATVRVVVAAYPELPVADRGHGRAWMPRTVTRDRLSDRTSRRSLMDCGDVGRPARFSGTEMLSVLTIDLERGLPAVDADAVMAGGQIVYASPTSLYVATERWPESGASQVTTAIHRFDIADPDSTRYVGSGEVTGYMLDQWSMSEQKGVLRVASTSSPPWVGDLQAGASESFVTALALEDHGLARIGRVGGLGRGEQIYAVRFIGDLGYVVTFRQVDPLYVLDLSDPGAPHKLGELKVPGYSAYLHPVGDALLLGIGQDATEEGQTTGVQASLFDVSDPSAPVLIDRESLGRGTYTEVEYDHHAFTYAPDQRLAVLPLESWLGPEHEFHGAVGIRVDPVTGLEPTGRTAQGQGYELAIRRTVLVGGRVFTVSDRGVAEHDPATLARLSFVPYSG